MRWGMIALAVFILLPLGSAEIIFSQPEAVYNIGDEVNLDVRVQPSSATNDFVTVKLVCPNGLVEVYKNPLTLGQGEVMEVPLNFFFGKNVVQNFQGACYFVGAYGAEYAESAHFELSTSIFVNAEVQGSPANPGDVLFISGSAQKANGNPAEGFVNFLVEGINTSFSAEVAEGVFSLNLTLPENLVGGQHALSTHVFEKDTNGQITNEGNAVAGIFVKTIVKKLELSFTQTEIEPNNSFVYAFHAYDQAGNLLERDISYTIYLPGGGFFLKDLAKTQSEHTLFMPSNATPGYWKMEASIEDLNAKRLFYVFEHEQAVFNLVNKTFSVTNTGNVRYKKTLEVTIGDYRELLEVDLPVGQVKKFKLTAPDSVYNVRISDGVNLLDMSGVALTGKAIGIGELKGSPLSKMGVGLFLLVIVSLVFLTNIFLKRQRFQGQGSTHKGKTSQGEFKSLPSNPPSGSPLSSSISNSGKEQAHVIAIRADAKSEQSNAALSSSFSQARRAGAYVYEDGNHTIMVFSPRFTKRQDNALLAVQTGKEIASSLENQNKNVKDKLAFGLGISKGEILTDTRGERQITALGALIPTTKRLANASQNDVLLSDEVYKSVMHSIKAEKVRDRDAWSVKEIVDRSAHKGFIDNFLKRYDK